MSYHNQGGNQPPDYRGQGAAFPENRHLPSMSPEDEAILALTRRVESLEATVKVFEKYSDRYTRFFSSFDEPFQGTTLT